MASSFGLSRRHPFQVHLTVKQPSPVQDFNHFLLFIFWIDRCTFVKDYNTFWTQVNSTLIRVGRSAIAGPTSAPEAAVTPAYQAPTTYKRDQSTFPYVSSTSPATTTTRIVSTSPVVSTTQWSFPKSVLSLLFN